MKTIKCSNFVIEGDFEENVVGRYEIIRLHMYRCFFIPIYVFIIYDLFFSLTPMSSLGSTQDPLRYLRNTAIPYLEWFMLFIIPLGICSLFCEWPRSANRLQKIVSRWKEKDLLMLLSSTSRTIYRYCASFELVDNKMIIVDKVIDQIGGEITPPKGKIDKDCMIKLELPIEQITAMWISRDFVVLRLCWGVDLGSEWDVILDRDRFTKGSDLDFIHFMSKNLIFKKISYSWDKVVNSNEKLRLGNDQTDVYRAPCLNSIFKQRRVKIYHNFWGPFKKRERKANDKENEK